MSVIAVASGTQTCVIGTEHTLYNPTPGVPGVFQFLVDPNALTAGDMLELRAKQILLTGGAARGVYLGAVEGVRPPDETILVSQPISNDLTDNGAVQFSITQVAGTGRSIPWKVLRLA